MKYFFIEHLSIAYTNNIGENFLLALFSKIALRSLKFQHLSWPTQSPNFNIIRSFEEQSKKQMFSFNIF